MISKEEIIIQVENLLKGERFKEDAFFFCGSKTITPNKNLIQACESYLADPTPESAEPLLDELRRIVEASELTQGKVQIESAEITNIKSLLDNSESF